LEIGVGLVGGSLSPAGVPDAVAPGVPGVDDVPDEDVPGVDDVPEPDGDVPGVDVPLPDEVPVSFAWRAGAPSVMSL
jgi:hypothetical protein